MALLFIVSSFSMKLSAQENLNALVKKCETMESVFINVVRTKNPQTKKIEKEIISINICKNPTLINEFVAAFKKDEEKATKVIESKNGGRTISLLYEVTTQPSCFSTSLILVIFIIK
jgi:site-specific DNA-adenine methylase